MIIEDEEMETVAKAKEKIGSKESNNENDFKTLVKKIADEIKKTIKCQNDQVNRITYTVLRNQSVVNSNMENKKSILKIYY